MCEIFGFVLIIWRVGCIVLVVEWMVFDIILFVKLSFINIILK